MTEDSKRSSNLSENNLESESPPCSPQSKNKDFPERSKYLINFLIRLVLPVPVNPHSDTTVGRSKTSGVIYHGVIESITRSIILSIPTNSDLSLSFVCWSFSKLFII